MEEKASLMISSQKIALRIEQLEKELANIEQSLQDLPVNCRKAQAKASQTAITDFNSKKQADIRKVETVVRNKKTEIAKMIDSCTEEGVSGPVNKDDIATVESHLKEIYPAEMISDYIAMNPLSFEDEEEALSYFTLAENAANNLRRGNLAAIIFNGLSATLDKAADFPSLGIKVAGGALVFILAGLIVSPFLFLTIFTFLGIVSSIQGMSVRSLLRKIYSVKMYLETEYDVEKFENDKNEIMDFVCPYLEEAGAQATAMIEAREYRADPSLLSTIEKKYDIEGKRLQESLDKGKQEHITLQKLLEDQLAKLELIEQKERKLAENAKGYYLGTIDWKKEWLDNIFIEVSQENKVLGAKFSMGNSLYYSQEPANLQNFGRLSIWQSVIHMHPDYCSTIVLDYKYNGGEVVQFTGLPQRCCRIAYTEDEISSVLESVNNRIRSRTSNILASCTSIEEYNALMATYETLGEYYVVVHIFGLKSFSETLMSNIRNGARVGYFFKFYWTIEELQTLKEDIPFKQIQDIYEILDNPMPRTIGAVRRLFEQ